MVDETEHDLHVPLRLHRAAHHAERPEQRATLQKHAGDDRVERPLARREPVGVAIVLDEAGRAILEGDSRPGGTTPDPNVP